MLSSATLHVHPACACNKKMIEQLQLATDRLVVIHNSKPKLVANACQPSPVNPNGGGHAA